MMNDNSMPPFGHFHGNGNGNNNNNNNGNGNMGRDGGNFGRMGPMGADPMFRGRGFGGQMPQGGGFSGPGPNAGPGGGDYPTDVDIQVGEVNQL